MHSILRPCLLTLGLSLLATQAGAQESIDPIKALVQQYESLSDKERITFLQSIALIGAQKSTQQPTLELATPAPASPVITPPVTSLPLPTAVSGPISANAATNSALEASKLLVSDPDPKEPAPQVEAKPQPEKTTTLVELPLAEPVTPAQDGEIQQAEPPKPVPLLAMPQARPTHLPPPPPPSPLPEATPTPTIEPPSAPQAPQSKPQPIKTSEPEPASQGIPLRVIVSHQMDYSFGRSDNPNNSVFALLLPEYQQKLSSTNTKIQVDDLRNEAINFYANNLEKELGDCGYQVLRHNDATPNPNRTAYTLETGIQRIVINKTLFETALIGEANARLMGSTPPAGEQNGLAQVQTRSSKALTQFDNANQRATELRTNLGQIIEQLSAQISNKLCSGKPSKI